MCAQRIISHELLSDLLSERPVQTAGDVNGREFLVLAFVVDFKLCVFTPQIGMFRIGL